MRSRGLWNSLFFYCFVFYSELHLARCATMELSLMKCCWDRWSAVGVSVGFSVPSLTIALLGSLLSYARWPASSLWQILRPFCFWKHPKPWSLPHCISIREVYRVALNLMLFLHSHEERFDIQGEAFVCVSQEFQGFPAQQITTCFQILQVWVFDNRLSFAEFSYYFRHPIVTESICSSTRHLRSG